MSYSVFCARRIGLADGLNPFNKALITIIKTVSIFTQHSIFKRNDKT